MAGIGVNLGGEEVEIGEITFPVGAGAGRRSHRHAHVEIFYVLSGRLDHIVNGTSHLLEPGMVGIVRPGDEVVHRVASETPVRALVIWAPGGEIERIAPGLRQRPVEGP
ncbi:MAG: cupin domain-containing protein [Gemmatimonadota bacterium]